ncbi:hypothetical protein IFM89_031515 [Coptis chinensis]|uniref:Uncharacterized protein n=1 Tax=Coptis chinensis TaxID=261450 RepID=A0A835IF39_9MAGN|nr:hypothetical protein IFM89_031515 [Coptis chinensis]
MLLCYQVYIFLSLFRFDGFRSITSVKHSAMWLEALIMLPRSLCSSITVKYVMFGVLWGNHIHIIKWGPFILGCPIKTPQLIFLERFSRVRETGEGIFEQVLKGELDFVSDPWPSISESAKDLVRKMLVRDPQKRLTAHEALCKCTFSFSSIIFKDEYDLTPDREAGVLLKTNIAWKGWKYRLRKIKESPDGKVTRTQIFVATHTSKDGSCFPAVKLSLDEIKRLVSLDPFLGNKDLDNDPVAKVLGRDGKGRVRGLGTGVSKAVVHAAAPYNRIIEEEKRKRETTDGNFKLVMQRLDEESRAHKIMEEKLEVYARDPLEFEKIFARCYAIRTMSIKELQGNLAVALGSVSSDFTSADSYSITVDDIFDYTTELYIGEGTLGDVSIVIQSNGPRLLLSPFDKG